jgi:alpha-tubulin suppressor-like RCC1 family protein
MSSNQRVTVNFIRSDGVDIAREWITKDYLISVYPEIGDKIGIPPELWTWGNGSNGRLGNAQTTNRSTPVTTFSGGTNWKQVSSGGTHTAAIKTDGTLWTWGNGNSGRLGNAVTTGNISTPVTVFGGGINWKQVSAGDTHTAAIKTDGTLWIWGFGDSGRLGNGVTAGTRSTPVTTFAGGNNWKQVSAGNAHMAAIKTDGTLWTWGFGSSGQLGNAQTTNRSTPVTTFAGGNNWKQVSAGNVYTAAIKTDGTLWTWGNGGSGRLGTNIVTTNRSTPITTFAGGTNWKQVSAGADHTAAIKTDGTLWTWGSGGSGQLGRLAIGSNRVTPVTTFAGGNNWADTATTEPEDLYTLNAGDRHTAAIKTDGTLWTWGNGSSGRLGNANITNRSTPVTTFAGGNNWKQVSSGIGFFSAHTAAIKTDGTLWTWGDGPSGRLGNGATTGTISTPVTTFAGGTNWKQVSSGDAYTAAIKTDGTLWTWGNGGFGRLGINNTTNRSTPVTIFGGGTNWKQVSAGTSHIAAIKTDGTLWTWGNGNSGRLGTNDTTQRNTPVTTFAGGTNWKQVSAGDDHTAAIKTDGTLWTWGNGFRGRLGNIITIASIISTPVTTFAGGNNWKQVSSGGTHTAAIKTDGTLWTWGNGDSGRLGDASLTDRSTPVTTFAGGINWKQVSAGSDHTIALKDDVVNKELYVFGNNTSGQLGADIISQDFVPNQTFQQTTDWKQVSSGNAHTAAIKTNGTLWTWGGGGSGRLGNASLTGRSTPVTTFAGGTNWKQVSAGDIHTTAIKSVDFTSF